MSILGAIEPTWPALRQFAQGRFVIREGAGGGKRVSAASFDGSGLPTPAELHAAEGTMRDLGQEKLFSLHPDQTQFDGMLEAQGYRKVDSTRGYIAPVAPFASVPIPPVTTFAVWEPLAIMRDLWAEGGIGPERLAVMDRVECAKTGILGRVDDTPAAAAFVAAHDGIAMLHALEVTPAHRRKGLARWMLIAAGHWAKAQGCDHLGLLVTEANDPANALYRTMGFEAQAGYHYRIKEE